MFLFVFLGILAVTGPLLASPLGSSPRNEIVSVSYQALLKCEPGLKDKSLSQRVDLQTLKKSIDNLYVTHRSLLMRRVVDFRERSGELRRLRLENYPEKGVSKFKAQWGTVGPKGETEVWNNPALKPNPSLSEIHLIIAKGVIERDETFIDEFKLKGVKLQARKDLHSFLELRLTRDDGSRTLICEAKKDLGTICTCTQK